MVCRNSAKAPEPTEAPAPEAEEPVRLRVGKTYIWDTENPTYGWYGYTLRYLLYDTLVEEADISNFVPGLAESWEVADHRYRSLQVGRLDGG